MMQSKKHSSCDRSVLILGIGNLLWADEGFGVRVVEALNEQYRFPEHVKIMDGGTQGIYLIQHVQAAKILVVFDAIDYGLAPGTLKLIRDGEVPKFMGAKKMSLHQTGFQEVLATAELTGSYPENILLIGVQPVELEDYGGSLRPAVRAKIPDAIKQALNYLNTFGISPEKRTHILSSEDAIGAVETKIDRYEYLRPDNATACRIGDERVLKNRQYRFDPKPSPLEKDVLSVSIDQRKPD